MASQAIVAARQVHVERLLLRGYSCRQIAKALETQRVINPQTGKPWSLGTVIGDQKSIEESWLEEAAKLRSQRKARADAEIQELKRVAWGERDYKLVAELIKQERQLWGLDEPLEIKADFSGTVTHRLEDDLVTAVDEMDEDELDAFIINQLEASGTPVDVPDNIIEGEYAIEGEGG